MSCKLPQLGPTLTLALSFTYSLTADSISLLTIWATWKKGGRYRDKESGMFVVFSRISYHIMAVCLFSLG